MPNVRFASHVRRAAAAAGAPHISPLGAAYRSRGRKRTRLMTKAPPRPLLWKSYAFGVAASISLAAALAALVRSPADAIAAPPPERLPINVPSVASDPSVRFDYDLVYVRAPRGT